MTQHYLGLTIGPIFETILEARKPASMWFASSFFSELTRQLCLALRDQDKGIVIFSPYIDKEPTLRDEKAKEDKKKQGIYPPPEGWDGIGKYHDRILCRTSLTKEGLDKIITSVKEQMVIYFGFNKEAEKKETQDFLTTYLQVSYVFLEERDIPKGANITTWLTHYLDFLELMPSFTATNDHNPFRNLFVTNDIKKDHGRESFNYSVKSSYLYGRVKKENNQLMSKKGHEEQDLSNIDLKDIKEIINAPTRSDHKHWKYFAIVNADGDRMGKLLETLCDGKTASEQVELVKTFSKACLSYTEAAAQAVGAYGGYTVYAGGDDLLFLAPLISPEKNLFDLLIGLNDLFDKHINQSEDLKPIVDLMPNKPSLSYGLSIQYHTYPLYEAFKLVNSLLAQAKKTRDCLALRLTKHSGAQISLTIPNWHLASVNDFLALPTYEANDEKEETLHSVLYHLEKLRAVFEKLAELSIPSAVAHRVPLSKEQFLVRFMNHFDNPNQLQFDQHISGLAEFYYDNFLATDNLSTTVEATTASLTAFMQYLRFKKFFAEKGGPDDRD